MKYEPFTKYYLNANINAEQCWKALSRVEELQQWFHKEIQDFEAISGFETRFKTEVSGKELTHILKVIVADKYNCLRLTLDFEEYKSFMNYSFFIFSDEKSTSIRFHFDNTAIFKLFRGEITEDYDFEYAIPDWETIITKRLQNHLDQKEKI